MYQCLTEHASESNQSASRLCVPKGVTYSGRQQRCQEHRLIPPRLVVVTAEGICVGLHVAAELDAGVGAGDVVEAGAIKEQIFTYWTGFALTGDQLPVPRVIAAMPAADPRIRVLIFAHKTSKFV